MHFCEERVGQPPHLAFCCRGGKLSNLPRYIEAPPELQELLTSSTRAAQDFRGNIRSYNAALAFISFGINCFKNVPGRGPPFV